MGSWTVTSLVPSGKVASIWTSSTIWDTLHNILTREDGGPEAHELGDALAVARSFEELGGDDSHGLGVVELQAAFPAAAGHLGGGEDHELLLLGGREPHLLPPRLEYPERITPVGTIPPPLTYSQRSGRLRGGLRRPAAVVEDDRRVTLLGR